MQLIRQVSRIHYMPTRARTAFAFFALLVILTACSTAVLLHQMTRPADRVVQTWQRPDSAYCLSVVEGDTDWRGVLFANTRQRYYLYAGRNCGQPGYGHFIDFTPASYLDSESLLKSATVSWASDGVTFALPVGHRLFIPRDAYEGGR
jgi:hypothetical protein